MDGLNTHIHKLRGRLTGNNSYQYFCECGYCEDSNGNVWNFGVHHKSYPGVPHTSYTLYTAKQEKQKKHKKGKK